jgi:hypothetical protein
MKTAELIAEIVAKGSDKTAIAQRWIAAQADVSMLVEGMQAKPAAMKFGCEKVLQRISELNPALVYPQWPRIAEFLEADNRILKWGAILILSNLAAVDVANHFSTLFDRYFRFISEHDMIAASNVVGGAPKIARAHPELAERIVRQILKVEQAVYKTPECRNVVIGQAMDALNSCFDLIEDKTAVLGFIERQLHNSRRAVATRARTYFARLKPNPPANMIPMGRPRVAGPRQLQ